MASSVSVSVDNDLNDSDQGIDALIGGVAWDISGSNILTFSFPDAASDINYTLGGGATFSDAFDVDQQAAARLALAEFAAICGLEFEEIGDDPGESNADGTIRFFEVTGISTAFAYYPNPFESGGDSAYSDGKYEGYEMVPGEYEYQTLIHELGHAMGLKHGHESGGGGASPTDIDSMEYSVMTYRSFAGQDMNDLPFYTNASDSFAQSLMMMDIAALQRLYGADYTTNADDTVYTFNKNNGEMSLNGVSFGDVTGNKVFRTVWDGDGEDTYDLSNYTTDLMLDLRPGYYSDFDVGGNFQRAELNFGIDKVGEDEDGPVYGYSRNYEEWASGHLYNALMHEDNVQSLIENAIGGDGNDKIYGNQVANTLHGKAGRDFLNGFEGADELYGGGAKDRLKGGAGSDLLSGGFGRDDLEGGNGKDILIGGKGNDSLNGGNGIDTFVFALDSSDDTVEDFVVGTDLLDFSALGFATKEAALALAGDSNGAAAFNFDDGTSIFLEGVLSASLTVDSFVIA